MIAVPNVFNLTSQLIETTIGVTIGRSNQQNNATSIRNTKEEYFSYFGTIRANPFEGFGAFRNNNNPSLGNNNNNNLPPLLPPSI